MHPLRGREQGMTLVELIIASAIFSLVSLTIMGLMFVTLNTEQSIRTVALATSEGQTAVRSMTRSITNAATPLQLATAGPGNADQILRARVVGGGATATWTCMAWYYSAADAEIRYTSSSGAIPTPTATQLDGWSLLASGVGASSGAVFSPTPSASLPTGVTISFRIDAGDSPAVTFETAVSSRTRVSGGAPCY